MHNSSNFDPHKNKLGPLGMLGLLLVALKITNNTKLPWIWVLAPFWIPFLGIALVALYALGSIVFYNLFGFGPYHPGAVS